MSTNRIQTFVCSLAAAGVLALPLVLAGQPLPMGPEIPAHLPGVGSNHDPSVAFGPDGGFVALWTADADGGPFSSGLVRAFSPAGQPLRAEPATLIPDRDGTVASPRITSFGSGRFLAVWAWLGGASSGVVAARFLDASGAPDGAPFEIGTGVDLSFSIAVAPLPSERFVAVWRTPSGGIVARRLDAAGRPLGSEILVTDQGAEPSVAALPNGGFVVAWQRSVASSALNGVFYRIFQPDGLPAAAEVRAHTPAPATRTRPQVSADAAGRFVIGWTEGLPPHGGRIVARRFAANGSPLEPEITVRTLPAGTSFRGDDVAVRPDGSFLVLWTEESVLARIYDANGDPVDGAFPVTDTPDGSGDSGGEAVADADGWVVSWSAFGDRVRLRRLVSTCRNGVPGFCLNEGRYRVEVFWETATQGTGHPIFLSGDTGAFWFFEPNNVELVVKVLDGGAVNGKVWVFYGVLTDVEFELAVTDRITGERRTYQNPGGRMASRADTEAFSAFSGGPFPDEVPPIQPLFTPRPLAAGPQIPLLDPGASPGNQPWVAVGADGSFAAIWQSLERFDWIVSGIATARVFSAAGAPVGFASRLSEEAQDKIVVAPQIVPLLSGDWLALWGNEFSSLPSGLAVGDGGTLSGRLLDASGQPAGSELLLLPSSSGVIATHPAGGALVAWAEGVSGPVKVQRFVSGAPAGPEILVTGSGSHPALSALPDGGFAVVWERYIDGFSASQIFARVFRPDGTPAGPEAAISPVGTFHTQASVSASSGGIRIAWTRWGPEGAVLFVRALGPAGQPLGVPLEVQTVPANGTIRNPSMALRPDGSFLVLWSQIVRPAPESGQIGEIADTLARVYRSDGTPAGAPFRVHDETGSTQNAGNAAATADGWLVSWEHASDLAPALYARRLASTCGAGVLGLCLNGGRFRAEASWRIPATGEHGTASPVVLTSGLTSDSGTFWFFSPENTELIVKVLDGRGVNGHFWVFYGSLTDVEFDLTITDTSTGQQRTYHNHAGTMASRADTNAF